MCLSTVNPSGVWKGGGGVRLVLHRTVFIFSLYFLTVLLLNVLRFFIIIE